MGDVRHDSASYSPALRTFQGKYSDDAGALPIVPPRTKAPRRQPVAAGDASARNSVARAADARTMRDRHGQFISGHVAFCRSSDVIPRGTIKSLYHALLNDDGTMAAEVLKYPVKGKKATMLPVRLALARTLVLRANDPRTGLVVAEQLADRLEGRPVQQIEARPPRRTILYKEGEPVPPGVVVDLPTQAQREDEIATAKRSIAAAALETLDDDDVPPVDGYPTATGHRR